MTSDSWRMEPWGPVTRTDRTRRTVPAGPTAGTATTTASRSGGGPARCCSAALALAGLATILGTVLLWPDGDEVDDGRGQVQLRGARASRSPSGEVTAVQRAVRAGRASTEDCGEIEVRVAEGAGRATEVDRVGYRPEVQQSDADGRRHGQADPHAGADGREATYNYFGTVRTAPLGVLLRAVRRAGAGGRPLARADGAARAGVRRPGDRRFMLPALLTGAAGLRSGWSARPPIMFVVLYTTHGFSLRTSAALAGTLAGIAASPPADRRGRDRPHPADRRGRRGARGMLVDLRRRPRPSRACSRARSSSPGLGVLNDVTITQASAVWELRAAAPAMSPGPRSSPAACGSAATTSPRRSTRSSSRTPAPRSRCCSCCGSTACPVADLLDDRGDHPGGRADAGQQHRPGPGRTADDRHRRARGSWKPALVRAKKLYTGQA